MANPEFATELVVEDAGTLVVGSGVDVELVELVSEETRWVDCASVPAADVPLAVAK